ncbi:MAG: biopolymer transporter ExbD [Spirochaetia bacterium]|nr:biopolymer transporter ExbD [Spirochaetia bacterium]
MRLKRRSHLKANVDLIPMIDIVFQLILFFLVSTTFAILPGIKVNLPESSTAKGEAKAGITITVKASGIMYFNDRQVTFETLDECLEKFDTEEKPRSEYPVTLEADSEVTNGTIVTVFDVLRKNGFSAVNLRTSKK